MATITPTWTENVTLRSAAALAAGATEGSDLDLDANGYDAATVQIDITHGSSTGVTVAILSSPDSGTTDDTESLAGGFSTDGTDVRKTVVVMSHAHVRVQFTNDDGSNQADSISAIYAGRKWSAA